MQISNLYFLQGLSLCFSLIIGIGIQNSFVLKQGILKNHNFITASICIAGDSILIILGTYGFGTVLSTSIFLQKLFLWAGITFLFAYGIFAFRSCFKSSRINLTKEQQNLTLKQVIKRTLIVSFFNPNAYLDTCILIGGVSSSLQGNQKLSFTIGAIAASAIWFSLLSFFSRFLKAFFEKPFSWKILDFVIGCTMFFIAISLILKH